MSNLIGLKKRILIEQEVERLQNLPRYQWKTTSLHSRCRPEISHKDLMTQEPTAVLDHGEEVNAQLEIQLKFAGYIKRQEQEAKKLLPTGRYPHSSALITHV